METLFLNIGIIAMVCVIALIARGLGWLATEAWRPLVNVKPFNCRPCLTFWLTILLVGIFAIVVSRFTPWHEIPSVRETDFYQVAAMGVLIAFINYLTLISKTKIYE